MSKEYHDNEVTDKNGNSMQCCYCANFEDEKGYCVDLVDCKVDGNSYKFKRKIVADCALCDHLEFDEITEEYFCESGNFDNFEGSCDELSYSGKFGINKFKDDFESSLKTLTDIVMINE